MAAIMLGIITVSAVFTGCGNSDGNETTSAQNISQENDSNKDFQYVEPLEEKVYVSSEWQESTFENELQNANAIIGCEIKDIKEICFVSKVEDVTENVYQSVVTVKINEIYKQYNKIKKDTEIKICISSSSRNFYDGTPDFKVGDEYILFVKDYELLEGDSLGASNAAEYYIGCPGMQMYPINGTEVEVSDMVAYEIKIDGEPIVDSEEFFDWWSMSKKDFESLLK